MKATTRQLTNLSLRILVFASAVTIGASAITGCSPDDDSKSQAQIVSDSASSVVRVEITTRNGDFVGSGFVVAGPIGVVVTAYHVVDGADTIVVRRGGAGSTANIVAELLVFDEILDLALLRVPPIGEGIELSDSPLETGNPVLAMGYPLGLEGDVSASQGIISRLINVEDDFYVQHDAEILQGNSGGPLLGADGKVVGVNIAVIPDIETVAGLNFAVHVGELVQMMNDSGLSPGVSVALPTSTATPTPTHTATPRPTATPRSTPTATPTATPSPVPTVTPIPTPLPTLTPSEINSTATADAEIMKTAVALKLIEATATTVSATISAEATVAQATVISERERISATATVQASIAAATASVIRATVAADSATSTSVAKANATATVSAVVNYCGDNSGEYLLRDPVGGSIEKSDEGQIGRTGIIADSPNFHLSARFYNPTSGNFDYGIGFRRAGLGDLDVVVISVDQYGIPRWYHYTKSPPVEIWTQLDKGNVNEYQTRYDKTQRGGNFLALEVEGRTGTVYLNDFLVATIKLKRADHLHTGIELLHGFFNDHPVDVLEYDSVSIQCAP
jgi:hypothetical protein